MAFSYEIHVVESFDNKKVFITVESFHNKKVFITRTQSMLAQKYMKNTNFNQQRGEEAI